MRIADDSLAFDQQIYFFMDSIPPPLL